MMVVLDKAVLIAEKGIKSTPQLTHSIEKVNMSQDIIESKEDKQNPFMIDIASSTTSSSVVLGSKTGPKRAPALDTSQDGGMFLPYHKHSLH